jgi:hypothetical protein
METEPHKEVQGSWDERGRDLDTIFATSFTSIRCLDAILRAQAKFHPLFPGWALYRRLLTGDPLLDRTLEAYAVGMARAVTRALKDNGRAVVPRSARRNDWIAQAGRDGLDFALFGKFPATVMERADRFKVRDESFRRVREIVGWGIWGGADAFATQAKYEYRFLGRQSEKS